MYFCKVVSNEKLVFKVSLKLPDYVYTIIKHYNFTMCYSKKTISVRTWPDVLSLLPQTVKSAKFYGALPPDPIGWLTAPYNLQAVVNLLRSLQDFRSYCSLCSLLKIARCYSVFASRCAEDQNPGGGLKSYIWSLGYIYESKPFLQKVFLGV